RRWLARDYGKHTFSDEEKRRLMEHLAADMWRAGAREWEWGKVESWLKRFLTEFRDFDHRNHGTHIEVLNEDLRTATFILRPDDSKTHFSFAHRSLQEYFLACHLVR